MLKNISILPEISACRQCMSFVIKYNENVSYNIYLNKFVVKYNENVSYSIYLNKFVVKYEENVSYSIYFSTITVYEYL